MAAIDQVLDDSQRQHQRYLDLFDPSPANGEGFRELSDTARQLVERINDIRDDVQALQLSTEVVFHYEQATASDHRPVATTAHASQVAASTTDTSAQVIREGMSAILSNANSEINQVSAVPDRDSPEGQNAILNIIAEHQARSVQTVTSSAAAQQANGAQAAAAAGGDAGGAAAFGGAATAAMGALFPAVESALFTAPQAAASLAPALAGLASAPAGTLTRSPAGAPSAGPQQSPASSPSTNSGGSASPSTPNSSQAVSPSAPHTPQAPVGPGAPTSPPPPPPHGNDHSNNDSHVQLAGFGSGQHAPETPPPTNAPRGQDPH